ncbi:MAG: hypothetical protein E7625_00160 [Ruminococcaceae bacterium]|nr:hypothetical protein [Oscillospiraceae bacterium]
MKTNKKTFLTLLMATLILWTMCVSVYASDTGTGISPRLDNCHDASMVFSVLDPGVAHFAVDYNGNAATFTQAKLTVTFQKKFLGLFWRKVDIGTTNNEWVGYCTDLRGSFYDTVTMDGTGTYRANFTLEIYGTSGTTDVIEKTIECKYN